MKLYFKHNDPSLTHYANNLDVFPNLSEKQIRDLWIKYKKKGDKNAKKKLIESNLKLVIPISRKYSKFGIEFFDLIEEGNLGLIEAIERYNPRKSLHFAAYATYWIERYIHKIIESQSKAIRIPQHIWDELRDWGKKCSEMERILGRHPTMDEMKNKLHFSAKQIKHIIDAIEISHTISSLDSPVDEDNEIMIMDVITDKTVAEPEKAIGLTKSNEELATALSKVGLRERGILELRFGLNKEKKKFTLQEIGKKLKLSRERIRQIEKRGITQLKWITRKMDIV